MTADPVDVDPPDTEPIPPPERTGLVPCLDLLLWGIPGRSVGISCTAADQGAPYGGEPPP